MGRWGVAPRDAAVVARLVIVVPAGAAVAVALHRPDAAAAVPGPAPGCPDAPPRPAGARRWWPHLAFDPPLRHPRRRRRRRPLRQGPRRCRAAAVPRCAARPDARRPGPDVSPPDDRVARRLRHCLRHREPLRVFHRHD